jgi:hypothetical protein
MDSTSEVHYSDWQPQLWLLGQSKSTVMTLKLDIPVRE